MCNVGTWPQTVQRIPLNTMTLSILTERVYTSQGVPISVVGTAQVSTAVSHIEWQSPVVFFKIGTFCWPFLALSIARALMYSISVGLRRRGGTISVDLSLFVLLYNANFINKLKFNDFFWKLKQFIDCKKMFSLQNQPTFHSEERLVNLCINPNPPSPCLVSYMMHTMVYTWRDRGCSIFIEINVKR